MADGRYTIYDIANAAGVSIATVSRVLRGENTVTEKTRKKVEDVILRFNYQPSAIARGLTLKHSKTFGIVLPRVDNPHYALFFKGAYDEAMKAGYSMLLFPWEAMQDSHESLASVVAERRLDGVIYLMEYAGEEDMNKQIEVLEAVKKYMPVTLIGTTQLKGRYPSVTIDLSECVKMAVEHLASLGHERIALIGGFSEKDAVSSRDAGYREALSYARLPYISSYRAFGRCTAEEGEMRMNEMLDSLIESQWPTAVIAANDIVALGVIHSVQAHGRRVPEDVSVIGCDDLFFDSYMQPALSSIHTNQDYIGRRAVQMLLDESIRTDEKVACTLVIRNSSAPKK
ncbi:MAG: LacI family DNA-binding transcriptional regulator [Clostridia bacterium]|nr:LacI family DNA-binding transcriptional regulator [Clostridia bacterium]